LSVPLVSAVGKLVLPVAFYRPTTPVESKSFTVP
jgi:hypothetical protein